jgi:hypothetical protein
MTIVTLIQVSLILLTVMALLRELLRRSNNFGKPKIEGMEELETLRG